MNCKHAYSTVVSALQSTPCFPRSWGPGIEDMAIHTTASSPVSAHTGGQLRTSWLLTQDLDPMSAALLRIPTLHTLFFVPLLQGRHTRAEFSYFPSTSIIASLHTSLITDQQRPMRKTLGLTIEPVEDNLDYPVLSDQGDALILSWSTVVLAGPACHMPLPPHGPGRMYAVPGLCLEELRKEKEGFVRGKTPNKRRWNGAIRVFLCNLQQAAKPSCCSTTSKQLPFSAVTLFTARTASAANS